MDCRNTVDTTRISYDCAVEMAVVVSRMLWPVIPSENSPKAVILAPKSEFQYAFMASSLVHDPIMGTLLLTSDDRLDTTTMSEIKRLNPTGIEGVPPVILVGPFGATVVRAIEQAGYQTIAITGNGVFSTAANVARYRQKIAPQSLDGPVSMFVVATETPFESMSVPYYSTHSGVPILFTRQGQLPAATAKVLREMKDKTVYVVGNRNSVSDAVIREINVIMTKSAKRIAGRDPFATAVKFAKYYDPETKLGWNRNEKGRGDAFTFSNIDRWDLAVAGAGMAHQGKHTPLLLVERDRASQVIIDYVEKLKPELEVPPAPPFMHGFIAGSQKEISSDTQAALELAMKIDEP